MILQSKLLIVIISVVLLGLPAATSAQEVEALHFDVVSGEGAINDIKRKQAHNPTVIIRDQLDRPVPDVEVTFRMPFAGPGGAFGPDKRSFTGTTDEAGQVVVSGLVPNQEEGRFNIAVFASYGGIEAQTMIPQSNTTVVGKPGGGGGSGVGKKVLTAVMVGGGVATIIALVSSSGSDSSTTTTVVATGPTKLSIGPIIVGGPR